MSSFEDPNHSLAPFARGSSVVNPLRLIYRNVISSVIRDVVLSLEREPIPVVRRCLDELELGEDRDKIEALIVEELQRMHEGVLVRNRLKLSEFAAWQAVQKSWL